MRALGLLVRSAVIAWTVVSILAVIFGRIWMRERYSRGGPIPVTQALQLLNPLRRFIHPVSGSLREFRLKEGDTVLELGPGPGYFTIEASRIVGDAGRVVSLDIQPGMLEILHARLIDQGIDSGGLIVGDATTLPLADDSCDCAYAVTVLGEIPDRPAALAELRRVLKPGGALAIMESINDPDYMLQEATSDLCRASGFELISQHRQRLGYSMVFTLPE